MAPPFAFVLRMHIVYPTLLRAPGGSQVGLRIPVLAGGFASQRRDLARQGGT